MNATTNDLAALLKADLSDRDNRLVLADALTDLGRDAEVNLLRDTTTSPVHVRRGKVVAKQQTWEVRYVGAPYGADEGGEVVSRHRSKEAAQQAAQALQSSPKYYRNTRVCKVAD